MKKAFREGYGVYEDGQSSFSVNCQAARDQGRLPLIEAVKRLRELAQLAGVTVTVKAARSALIESHDGEWHHTSKYGNRTNYYNPLAAFVHLGIRLRL